MYQEIVIGPSLIDYLRKSYKQFDFNSEGVIFLQRVQEDYICFDRQGKLSDYIDAQIKKHDDKLIQQLWQYIPIKQKLIDVENQNNSQDLEASLATKAKDHLWISDVVTKEDIDQYKKIYGKKSIRHFSHRNYTHPKKGSLIIYDGMRHELKVGDRFPILKILSITLRDAQKVFIQDGYAVEPKAFPNLVKIVRQINDDAKIIIHILHDSLRRDSRFEAVKKAEELKEIFPEKKIEFRYAKIKKNCKQRYIHTEKLMISIGHGLDSFDGSEIIGQTSFGITKRITGV